MTQGRVRMSADVLAVTVHGPVGALDLMVPSGSAVTEVAREYAAQAGLASIPLLYTRTGDLLLASATLAEAGVQTGSILVATTGVSRPARATRAAPAGRKPRAAGGIGLELWCSLAAATAVLSGWCAAHVNGRAHVVAVAALSATALLGLVPADRRSGRQVVPRVLAAPCFAGAAGFAWAWDPEPARLPMVLGLAAAATAAGAALARAGAARAEAQLQVVVIAGAVVFVVTGALTLLGWAPRADWAILLALALLGARFVPGLAVDVPDQYLVDFERLAVTAWSARDRGPRRRVRSIVPIVAVADLADRGARMVAASCAAILVVAATTAPLLLWTAVLPVDRVGARLEVLLVGAGLLLAARSYRQTAARILLRAAGIACWLSLAVYLAPRLSSGQLLAVSLGSVALGLLVVLAAMATGRGWRSAWWSRRAEVAEALCGSSALAVVLVASGFFRHLWELTS
jgi:hypothetical protein